MIKKILRPFLLTFFCFFTFFSIFSSLYGEMLGYENQTIKEFNIILHTSEGETNATPTLFNRLRTKEGGIFSQDAFDEDLKLLSEDYDRLEPSMDECEGLLSLTIHLWSKATIQSICWVGNAGIDTSRLQKELGIKCFSLFEREKFNEAFHKVKALYITKGFFEAELSYDVQIDEETNAVCITITINEGRSGRIRNILFNNFDECEQSSILHQMVTKEYNHFLSWYTEEGTYNQDAVEQDRLTITNYLQNKGFADAEVTIEVTEDCKPNRVNLLITANRGEFYTFKSISFEGNCVFDDCTIDALFLTRPGDPFSVESVRDSIECLTKAYGRLGYIDTGIDYEMERIEGEHAYKLHFKIEEGEQFRVGLVRVFGNVTTKTSVILHETLMIPGEIFNTKKLRATEERLNNIGYFKTVNVYIVKGTDSTLADGHYRDVYIEVQEGDAGNFTASLGYSTVEEVFGTLKLTERNFNHEGLMKIRSKGLRALRGGGEYLQLGVEVGQKSREYSISWTKPYFMDTKWSIGFDLTDTCTRYISKDYDFETVSLVLRAQYDINQFWHYGAQYRLSNGNVGLHGHADRSKGLKKDARIAGLISAIGTWVAFDSTNHPVRPSKGFRSRLSAEYAGLGGDHHFFNFNYNNAFYYPVGSRFVMKYKADFRFIQPLGNTHFDSIPLEERIFLGGEYMVRGFRPYRLGPHYKNLRDVPKGGLSLQFYSIEMNRRITEDLEVFAFMDAGHLSEDNWEFGRLSVSIGYGARFRIKWIPSIPPVTIGMGYPLNAHHRSDVKHFFFSFGTNF